MKSGYQFSAAGTEPLRFRTLTVYVRRGNQNEMQFDTHALCVLCVLYDVY